MKKSVILYILGIAGAFLICVFLMTNGKVPIFDTTNNIVYTTSYLEIGSAIALLVGLLAFLTSIFTNYYTNENNKENILMQLRHRDEKESLIKLLLIIDKISINEVMNIRGRNLKSNPPFDKLNENQTMGDLYYNQFSDNFEKFKNSENYYNYYSLPKKFKDLTDDIINKSFVFPDSNHDFNSFEKNKKYLKKLIDNEINDKY